MESVKHDISVQNCLCYCVSPRKRKKNEQKCYCSKWASYSTR